MTGAALRDLGIALAGVAALLRGGVSAADALRAGAERVPALGRAAEQAAGGRPAAEALADALPDFAALLRGPVPDLPDRLERLAETCVRRYGLARRLRTASAYPMVMAVGLLVIAGAVFIGDLWGRDAILSAVGGVVPTGVAPPVLAGLAALLFGLGLVGYVRRTPPIWLRVLPGQAVYGLSAAADYLASYGLHREVAGLDPSAAATRLGGPVEAELERRGATLALPLLRLAEAAPDPIAALRDAVGRLDEEAARAARHLAASTAAVLLIAVALGVVALGFSSLYRPIFQVAG